MKKFELEEQVLFLGNSGEIHSLANAMRRAEKRTARAYWAGNPTQSRTILRAEYLDFPVFRPYAMYGLLITADHTWSVVRGEVALTLLYPDELTLSGFGTEHDGFGRTHRRTIERRFKRTVL